MSRTGALMAAGVASLVALGAALPASAATGPRWRVVKSVKTDYTGNFTAVAATGKTTAWAFDGDGYTRPPAAYQLRAGGWRRAPFPGKKNEAVVTAAATSPADVWAFTQVSSTQSRVLRYNGHAWSVVRTFSRPIGGASVVAANDVWVFGIAAFTGQPALGVWHYNGARWTRVSATIQGGSALSATSVWGYQGTSVEHWTGRKWIATPVRSLLPPRDPHGLNDPQIAGVLALSARDVYAVGNGTAQDEGGPLVVLHYNGTKWSRVAEGSFGFGPDPEFSTDGHGGLWLPMMGPVGGTSRLVHYASGKLTAATLPVAAPRIMVTAVSRIPGTTQQLAGGFTHSAANPGAGVAAVLLKYS